MTSFAFLISVMYPGDEAMKGFQTLLSDPMYEAFLGEIGGINPSYNLWQSFISPFLGIILAIFGLLLGVRIAMKPISDQTGEIVFSLPISREELLLSRLLAAVIYAIIMLFAWFLILAIPINGNYLELSLVWNLAWWAFLFAILTIMIGVLLGNLIGDSGRGAQISLIFILLLFTIQVVFNAQKVNLNKTELFTYSSGTKTYTLYNLLTDANLNSWYSPTAVILGGSMDYKYIWIICISLVVLTVLVFLTYQQKDLINDRGLLSFRRKNKATTINADHVKPHKSVKKSIYTFWIRPLEQKFPHTADFIYSERRALLILALAILLFWPLQLVAYPGDSTAILAVSGFNGGIFTVFTYGYNLLLYPPWVWWTVTQALGLHWFYFVPMVMRWIRSVPIRDSEDGTGDLIGSLPVRKKLVVFQRLFAVFLELIWISFWICIWYLISAGFVESRVGSIVTPANPATDAPAVIFAFTNPFSTTWMILAIFSQIALYMFLVTSGVAISLLFREKGHKAALVYLFVQLFGFIIAFSLPNANLEWLAFSFGFYNPVAIVIKESLTVAHNGVLILVILTFVSLFVVDKSTKYFTWLKQSKADIPEE